MKTSNHFKTKFEKSCPGFKILKLSFIFTFLISLGTSAQVITKVANGASSIDFTINAPEAGTLFYVLYSISPGSATTSSILTDSKATLSGNIVRNGSIVVKDNQKNQNLIRLISNLTDNKSYYLYAFYQGNSSNGPVENITANLSVRHLATSYTSQLSGQAGYKVRYWIYRPESYYKNTSKTYPLLMFYHGLGEIGSTDEDISKVLANGPPKLIDQGQEMEFIVVSPQSYNDGSGPVRYAFPGWLDEVLETIKSQNRVDINRVYLTGLSLGGRGCYYLAANQPSKIAAIMPASGVFDNVSDAQVCEMKDIPFWGFNNDNDPTVNYGWNLRRFISTVNSCSPAPIVAPITTIFSSSNHDSWTTMYNTKEIYPWMLSKTKSQPLNQVLTINAGGTVEVGSSSYTFSPSISSPNGTIASYEWTKRSGGDVTIINPNSANAIVQDLKQGSYSFRLFVTDTKGASSYNDVIINASPGSDSQAPTPPQNLASSNVSATGVLLNWSASTDNIGVTGYDIYKGGNIIASVSGTSYNVSGLSPLTNYSFSVVAKDAAGNISGSSNTLAVTTTTDTSAPTSPSNLASSSQTINTISLNWSASSDNVGVTGYSIYNGTNLVNSVAGNILNYIVTGLDPNTNYSITVKAKDGAGNLSSASNVLVVSTKSASAPSITSQPVSQSVDSGGNVSFNITASGTDPLTYQWLKNGTNISGATSNTLSLVNLSSSDNGSKFKCFISNNYGNITSNEVVLSVLSIVPGSGLTANYYNNSVDFSSSVTLTRTDSLVNFDWGFGSPDPSISNNTFTAQWIGKILAKYSEEYTFYVSSDDGSRLWVNGQLLIDKWVNQGNTEWSGKITLTAGQKYDIKLQYFENGGGASCKMMWGSASQTKQIIPKKQLYDELSQQSALANENGLNATYYTNSYKDFSVSPTLTRIDNVINFNWANGSPASSISNNNFTTRWTGKILANYSEEYTFYTSTDDGVRLWINNQAVIDKWIDQMTTEWSGKITLVAGQKYDIKLEYYEAGGNANCSLSWSSVSQTRQIVPSSQLFTNSTNITRTYLMENKTEVEENPLENDNLIIYPVPTEGELNLKMASNIDQSAGIQIYNLMGMPVLQTEKLLSKGENLISIYLQELISGQYFVKVSLKDKTFTKKFTKL